jgi:hypothetical protein
LTTITTTGVGMTLESEGVGRCCGHVGVIKRFQVIKVYLCYLKIIFEFLAELLFIKKKPTNLIQSTE